MTRLSLDDDGRVRHDIRRDELSNDLAGWIADDLVAPGLLDPAGFEDAFVGVVQAVDPRLPMTGPGGRAAARERRGRQ